MRKKKNKKKNTPHKDSIHSKQLVTVFSATLFLLLEHFTKATDSHPFTNGNRRGRRDSAKVTKQSVQEPAADSTFALFLLQSLHLPDLILWATGVCKRQALPPTANKVSHPSCREFFIL